MRCSFLAAAALGVLSSSSLLSDTPPQTARTVSSVESSSTSAGNSARPVISREMRADIYMARKMYAEAIDQYKAAPPSAKVSNKIGIAYHQLQDLSAAKKYYQEAIRQDAKFSDAINNLGTVYYSQKSYRRAIGQYKKALRLAPASATIYSNLGSAYFSRNDMKRAAESYAKALALDPAVFENQSTTGVLLQERSIEDKAKYFYFVARLYAKRGDTDRALQSIRKALEAGFKDRKKLRSDPDFASLQKLPEFQQLMNAEPPRVL